MLGLATGPTRWATGQQKWFVYRDNVVLVTTPVDLTGLEREVTAGLLLAGPTARGTAEANEAGAAFAAPARRAPTEPSLTAGAALMRRMTHRAGGAERRRTPGGGVTRS